MLVRALGIGFAGDRAGRAGDRRRGLHCQARRRRLPAGHASPVRVAELVMRGLTFDIAHMLAGSLVLVSFMQLYQDRLYALLNVYALHAFVLALSVAWQAYIQNAPHLYVTAAIALVF